MAQLGDSLGEELLRRAARAFGRERGSPARAASSPKPRSRSYRATLGRPEKALDAARAVLEPHGDRANAAHAGYLEPVTCC